MPNPVNKLVFKDDDYEIREWQIWYRDSAYGESYFIVCYNMPTFSFVLVPLSFPQDSARNVSELTDGDYTLLWHFTEEAAQLKPWMKKTLLDKWFTLYEL